MHRNGRLAHLKPEVEQAVSNARRRPSLRGKPIRSDEDDRDEILRRRVAREYQRTANQG